MKLEVTQPGVYQDGKSIEVGAVIEVAGDTIPASLVNKVRNLDGETVAITNPADGAIQEPVLDRDELKKQADELGLEYARNIKTEALKDLIDAKLAS